MSDEKQKLNRGFRGMDAARQRQIASMGGKTAHELGRAHEFTTEEARNAGRKGGQTVSRDRAHMADIGRRGGIARGRTYLSQVERDFLLCLAEGGIAEHESGSDEITLSDSAGAISKRLAFTTVTRLAQRRLITETANPPHSHTRALIRLTDTGKQRVATLRTLDSSRAPTNGRAFLPTQPEEIAP